MLTGVQQHPILTARRPDKDSREQGPAMRAGVVLFHALILDGAFAVEPQGFMRLGGGRLPVEVRARGARLNPELHFDQVNWRSTTPEIVTAKSTCWKSFGYHLACPALGVRERVLKIDKDFTLRKLVHQEFFEHRGTVAPTDDGARVVATVWIGISRSIFPLSIDDDPMRWDVNFLVHAGHLGLRRAYGGILA
ncbi:hypothetical protein PQR02_35460 [Paraburkholderia sediminicola]|uniref:Uncharacterized protein n=1 Tax=Paraburkholderia rhynchosiae TaxID=487049 RepID=A0ACC7NLS7_9BURK